MDIKLRKDISDITNNYNDYLFDLPNVNGMGFGFKHINGINTHEPCIHVLVENKIDSKYIPKNNLIPKTYMGIKTDVINIGRILSKDEFTSLNSEKLGLDKLLSPNSRKYRPLQAGCGISCFNNRYIAINGTLGCIVTKIINKERQYYILSNNHVLAYENKLPIGTSITQPSVSVGGIPYLNSVATLDDFIPTEFITKDSRPANYVDCAIAKIKNKSLVSNKVVGLGLITGVAEAEIDLHVKKSGFRTGITEGVVETLDMVAYFGDSPEESYYKDQIGMDLFAGPGDSGSTVIDNQGRVIGLVMSTSKNGFTLANKIQSVLDALNVKIYTYNDDIIIV